MTALIRPVRVLLVFLLAAPAMWGGNRNAYPIPEERGTAGILSALEKLPVYARVLFVTAHPDDESAASLTWLARGAHARTALLSLTRGDGGQNVLGDEKYEAMGVVRTGELLEACRIYGTETYFTTVFEFGFSKSAEETLTKWGHDQTLGEVVRFIRTWRPDVIISGFSGTSRDGHGHHQTAGLMAHEAFRAAGDPAKFPGTEPWQAKKLYRRYGRGEGETGGPGGGGPAGDDWSVKLDVGATDPVLGRSFREIGSEGYGKHRSQGSGASYAPPGASAEYYKLMDSTVSKPGREQTFFDSFGTKLPAILELAGGARSSAAFLESDLAAAQRAADEALAAFRPRQPAASAAAAARGVRILAEAGRNVEGSGVPPVGRERLGDALFEKRLDFEAAVNASLGIYVTARADDATIVPGENVPVTVQFYNRGSETVDLKRVTLWTPEGWIVSLPAGAPLGKVGAGESATFKHTVAVPADARATEPFWYRESPEDTRYKTRPTRNVFAPFGEPEIRAQATYRFQDVEVSIWSPARAQVNDPIRGVDFRDVQVVPALSVTAAPEFGVAPVSSSRQTRELQVSVMSNSKTAARGTLELAVPSGWEVRPRTAPFELARKGESFTTKFGLELPPGLAPGRYPVEAIGRLDGREFRRGYRVISYTENWTRNLYSPARSEVKVFDVQVPSGLTVGYVPGAGDDVPASLQNLGVKVEILTGADLAFGDLGRFSAVITGIRAYNVNEDLKANNQRLLRYVEQGGLLIVQYNTPARAPGRGQGSTFPYGPYPMSNSTGDRITVEESPVRILQPAHAIFTRPNRITQADFEGWVQERGLYFMREWDPRYTALLSGNDPGEKPLDGGWLVARHGKGTYVFTGYAWFRQLPAGVPGAYRIFANMLSLGR